WFSADQHRSHRRDGRRDGRKMARDRGESGGAAPRFRDDLSDGSTVQHRHLSADESGGKTGRARGGLGNEARVGGLRLSRVRKNRLYGDKRNDGGARPGESE